MCCKQINNLFSCILVSLLCLVLPTKLAAQSNPLTKRISLHCSQTSVEKTLATMSNQAHIYFSYNPDILPLDSLITIHVQQKEVQDILRQMFGNRYVYKTTGNYIIIQKAKTNQQIAAAKQQKPIQVKGTVKEESGAGISNTSVYAVNGKQQVLTDAQGNFELTMTPGDDIAIAIQNQNYEDTVMILNQKTDSVFTISLKTKLLQDTTLRAYGKEISKQAIDQVGMVSSLITKEIKSHAANIDFFTERPFQISLVPYVGTNHALSGTITNILSLNVIAGYSYGVNGCEIGGILNMNRTQVRGVQISGFGNITGGYVRGAQIAGFFNHTLGTSKGIQIAGFSNVLKDTVQGISIAGFSNIVKQDASGVQVGGFVNTAQDISGIQLAGFTNISHGNVQGIQTTGFANVCTDSLEGIQIAGFSNSVKNSARGVQIAGCINTAQRLDGIQIALINKADSVSGLSIGLLNFIKYGYHSLAVLSDETGAITLQSQFGTHRLYTTIGLVTYYSTQRYMAGLEYGLGTILRYKKRVQIHFDGTVTNIAQDIRNQQNHVQLYSMSGSLSVGLGQHLRIFGGPSYKALMYNTNEIDTSPLPSTSIPLYSNTYSYSPVTIDTWVGLRCGIQYMW